MKNLLSLAIFAFILTSCATIDDEIYIEEVLFDVRDLNVGKKHIIDGYISFKPESYSIYPNVAFDSYSDNCIHLINIGDFFSRNDSGRRVKIEILRIKDPYEGYITFFTCAKHSASIVNVVDRGELF